MSSFIATLGAPPDHVAPPASRQISATGSVAHTPNASDRDQMSMLFDQQHRRLLMMARRLLGEHAAAEDAVQDCFLRAWRGWSAFRGESTRATWIYGIAVRCALNHLRSRQRDLLSADGDGVIVDSAASPPVQLDVRMDLERAIALLPARARAVFVLRDVEGFSVADVAELLDVAEGTVKAHLFNARKRLVLQLTSHD
jgi:RNA polymerase sigma factor (sigma-70 family)